MRGPLSESDCSSYNLSTSFLKWKISVDDMDYSILDFVCLIGLMFYAPVNSYGHVTSSHIVSWSSLTKRLTSTLCTFFRL